MAIPFREWTKFYITTLEAFAATNNFETSAKWTETHYGHGQIGRSYPSANHFWRWDALIKPIASDFALIEGMDEIIDCQFEHVLVLDSANCHNGVGINLRMYFMNDPKWPDTWDPKKVSGRYYDGETNWSVYPQDAEFVANHDPTIPVVAGGYVFPMFSHLAELHLCKACSVADFGGTAYSNLEQEELFRNGVVFWVATICNAAGGSVSIYLNDNISYFVIPHKMNIRYFNPVVNSLSRYNAPTAGGVEVILSGLGFDMVDTEISDISRHPQNAIPAGGWNHVVEYIYFEGLQGQGQYKLNRTGGDFTVDSNLQITIPANKFPAMAAGTYNIRLKTWNVEDVGIVYAWAGDWNCDADGRSYQSTRISFYVGTLPTPGQGDYLVCGSYAPIDIRLNENSNGVLNGGFGSDATEWTRVDTTITLASVAGGTVGNCLRITSNASGANKYAYQEILGLTVGRKYHFQGYFKKGTASGGFIKLGTTQGGNEITSWVNLTDADWQIYQHNFTATTTSVYINLGIEQASTTAFFDEMTLYDAPAFYDGRIISHSSLRRALDDKSGLGAISDMDIEFANTDKYFSMLAATEFLKNQVMETFHSWTSQNGVEKSTFFNGIIDDYTLAGDIFTVKLKDITQKYFMAKVPRENCTEEDFPNIHSDDIGMPMPEVLGYCYFGSTEAKGAIRAIYVDTTTFKYLLARSPLTIIFDVYADGILVTAANYTVSYDENGHTYITFTADQGEKKITYNAQGYAYADWNSTNNYIRNPAYIWLYYVAFICEIPIANIDIASFDAMADFFTSLREEEAGYLIIQDEKDPGDVLQELSVTYGLTGYIAKDGRYTVGRKDISDFSADTIFFGQIHCVEPPEWQPRYNEAVNYLKAKYNYYPDPAIFGGSKTMTYEASKDHFGAWVSEEIEFPWTTSTDMCWRRMAEELLRRGYGNKKVRFAVSTEFLDDLDLFTNLKLQDPFAVSTDGTGTVGQYVYVESMDVDLQAGRIDIVAADYTWVLRQYFILGDRTELASLWANADEADRMYGYLSDRVSGHFSDNEPSKTLADRNQQTS